MNLYSQVVFLGMVYTFARGDNLIQGTGMEETELAHLKKLC